jgi:hypothetical protein
MMMMMMTMTNAAENVAYPITKIDFKKLDETDLFAELLLREDAAWGEMIRWLRSSAARRGAQERQGRRGPGARKRLARRRDRGSSSLVAGERHAQDPHVASGPKIARFGSWLGMLVRQAAMITRAPRRVICRSEP